MSVPVRCRVSTVRILETQTPKTQTPKNLRDTAVVIASILITIAASLAVAPQHAAAQADPAAAEAAAPATVGIETGTTENSWFVRYGDRAGNKNHQAWNDENGRPKGGKICLAPPDWLFLDLGGFGDDWVEIPEVRPGPEWYAVPLICPMGRARGPANVMAWSNRGREVDVNQRIDDWWATNAALEALIPERAIRHSPSGGTIAGVDTYFWIDGYDGTPRTEALPGVPVPITVTIELESVDWHFDGGGQTSGLGVPNKANVSHVFQDRGISTVTAEFLFTASFSVDGGPPVDLPPLTATEQLSLPITELQAVIGS